MDDLPAEPRRVFGLPQQRQKAVDILNHCYTNDLLDLNEFEVRLGMVEKALTLDDLDAVLKDIPDEHRNLGPGLTALSETEALVCSMSTKRVSDSQLLTKVLDAQATMGTLVLDYRRLSLPPGSLELQLKTNMATCKIYLPPGVQVELRLQETMSTVKETPDYAWGSQKPVTILRLTGEARMSSVKILRRSRLSLWWERVRGGPKRLA